MAVDDSSFFAWHHSSFTSLVCYSCFCQPYFYTHPPTTIITAVPVPPSRHTIPTPLAYLYRASGNRGKDFYSRKWKNQAGEGGFASQPLLRAKFFALPLVVDKLVEGYVRKDGVEESVEVYLADRLYCLFGFLSNKDLFIELCANYTLNDHISNIKT